MINKCDPQENFSYQSADRALVKYCERLHIVTPDLLRKSTPDGFVEKISGKRR